MHQQGSKICQVKNMFVFITGNMCCFVHEKSIQTFTHVSHNPLIWESFVTGGVTRCDVLLKKKKKVFFAGTE